MAKIKDAPMDCPACGGRGRLRSTGGKCDVCNGTGRMTSSGAGGKEPLVLRKPGEPSGWGERYQTADAANGGRRARLHRALDKVLDRAAVRDEGAIPPPEHKATAAEVARWKNAPEVPKPIGRVKKQWAQ